MESEDFLQRNLESALGGRVQDLRAVSQTHDQELKIWIIVRTDVNITEPKRCAQCSHAAFTVGVIADRKDPDLVSRYMASAQPKIAVRTKGEDKLLGLVELCKDAGIPAVAVQDAARTELDHPTWTVGAVGPCRFSDLPKKVRDLQLLRPYDLEKSRLDSPSPE